ncbi:hypothetical protein C9974_02040 [Marinobacter sp. B9-2]|nr:hypothetical protein C9974_02040 [Marinobacter sp. B9-2]
MSFSVFSRAYKPVIASLMLLFTSGCASYYSHFAMFPAENSSGQPRQVRLTWQSAEYPDWWFAGDKATSVKLELLVSCTPAVVTEGQGDDVVNLDYLRASSVPYTVYVRKAPRGSMRARLPEFDESVCDAE